MPAFAAREKARLLAARDALFGDPGGGLFRGRRYPFVLRDPVRNLWPGIAADALACFARNGIVWHEGVDASTGHVLSSQVACVNHLYPLRRRVDAATAVLAGIDPTVIAAEPIEDGGFVAFEFIGSRQHLAERGFTRGAHCTSVDAAMVGRTAAGERRLFLIEWKYTESYAPNDLYIPARAAVYDALIDGSTSPFMRLPAGALYVEPFYQLMRQTLLGVALTAADELGCSSFVHVHVVPEANRALRDRVTAPALAGTDLHAAWRAVLRRTERFVVRTPAALLAPIAALDDTRSHREYLTARYWAGDPVGG